MDESGDCPGEYDNQPVCDAAPEPSAAMIVIMVVSMLCTMASTARTFLSSRRQEQRIAYETYHENGVEMLDLRMP